jgi:hypothetical protein
MADGRKNNGGHKTAGRKPKADEMRIRDMVSPYIDGTIEKVANIMNNAKRESDQLAAAKLLLEYYFGKPKQQTDITTNGESIKYKLGELVKFD